MKNIHHSISLSLGFRKAKGHLKGSKVLFVELKQTATVEANLNKNENKLLFNNYASRNLY